MKSKALQKERLRLEGIKEKDFVSRNFQVKWAAEWILYPIIALWSAFTAGGYLYTQFEKTFNDFEIAIGFTILVAILIEVGKYKFGYSSMDDLYDGVLSEPRESKIAFFLKLSAAFVFFYFSITASLSGGHTSAEYWKSKTAPPALVSLEDIKLEYEGYIGDQEKEKTRAATMTWKGKIVRKGQSIIDNANSEVIRLNQEREAKLADARKENEAIIAAWEKETTKTGSWFTGLAGLGELLAIIILIFCVNYESGGKPSETATTQLATERNGVSQPFDETSFINRIVEQLRPETLPKATPTINADATNSGMIETAFNGALRNQPKLESETVAPKPAQPSLQLAATPETETVAQRSATVGKTGLVIKNKKVLHINSRGEEKWYDMDGVKRNLAANKSKAKKFKDNGNDVKYKEWMNKAATWQAYAQEIAEATHIE